MMPFAGLLVCLLVCAVGFHGTPVKKKARPTIEKGICSSASLRVIRVKFSGRLLLFIWLAGMPHMMKMNSPTPMFACLSYDFSAFSFLSVLRSGFPPICYFPKDSVSTEQIRRESSACSKAIFSSCGKWASNVCPSQS